MDITKEIQNKLFEMQDQKYQKFHSALMPTILKTKVIGVRVPRLKDYAKTLKTVDVSGFLNTLPHKFYEENNLHAFLIAEIKYFDQCITAVNRFLPFVDNWATCDSLRPKCFKDNSEKLLNEIKKWLRSKHTYTIRFGIEMLMVHFLGNSFQPKFLNMVAEIKSQEYYVNMMIAWYFATALAKHWQETIVVLEKHILSKDVHNKTIQKAVESCRITLNQKQYLKTLRW